MPPPLGGGQEPSERTWASHMTTAGLMLRRLQGRIGARVAGRRLSVPAALVGCVALVLLSAFAYRDLFGGGMILTGDTLHATRIFEMRRCLDDGQIPCRWVPDMGNGYGFPLFNYYPPLPYYVGDLLQQSFDLSYLRTVDLLYAIGLVGAGLAMFALTRRLWGDLGGLVSAVAYVYTPYLALDVYLRGALAELWGLALAPALFWAVYELVTTTRPLFVPLIALFLGLLLLSHNLVALIVAPALALWVVLLLLTRGRQAWRPALLGAAAALWGLALAAFFILPVLRQGNDVQLDTIAETLDRKEFLYSSNFVTVDDLFLLRTNDYSLLLGGREDQPIQIGWLHWVLAGLSLPAAFIFLRTRRWWAALAVLVFVASFGAGVFMAVSRSRFIWDEFDSLRFLQFPWRYMGLVSLASAGLAGAWLGLLRSRPLWLQASIAAALIGGFIGANELLFQPHYRCTAAPNPVDCPNSDAEYFSEERFVAIQQASIRDYLPAAVDVIPQDPPKSSLRIVRGPARVLDISKGSDWLHFQIEATRSTQVEAALFDFPEWRVQIDGRRVPHIASIPHGLITFGVPAGVHQVEIELEDTFVRRWGNRISLLAWAALALTAPALLLAPELRRWGARLWRRWRPG